VNESHIIRFCFFGALIGIASLYFISVGFSATHVDISEIDSSFIGQAVTVRGTVSGLYIHENGHIFFDLNDPAEGDEYIKVVIWEDSVKQLELKNVNIYEVQEGDEIELTGVVELYEGSLEIIPLRAQVKLI